MSKIAFFSIPAHGHTNPMLPVAAELVARGCEVRFYSFSEFREKIEVTGATFIECDGFLGKLSDKSKKKLKSVSATEMTVQDISITISMNDFLEDEFTSFGPDAVFCDSVCFCGKLAARKYNVPIVVSTSTFAFNRFSSRYIKQSIREIFDILSGIPKISRAIKSLEPYGYKIDNPLSLIENTNDTDTVVYTSKKFQPCADTFSSRYAFVGPSVFSQALPSKEKERPLVYISMGTVINERPKLYKNCIRALRDTDVDVIISCGRDTDISALGDIPENIKVFPYVDQLDILSRADVFITHCGMNSVSEALYMATPMVLLPQTGEQFAVARRVSELGAGAFLTNDSPKSIKERVTEILSSPSFVKAASDLSADFRSCGGAKQAADFIEKAAEK